MLFVVGVTLAYLLLLGFTIYKVRGPLAQRGRWRHTKGTGGGREGGRALLSISRGGGGGVKKQQPDGTSHRGSDTPPPP